MVRLQAFSFKWQNKNLLPSKSTKEEISVAENGWQERNMIGIDPISDSSCFVFTFKNMQGLSYFIKDKGDTSVGLLA